MHSALSRNTSQPLKKKTNHLSEHPSMHRNRTRICVLPSPSQNSSSITFGLEYYLSLLGLIYYFLVNHNGFLLIVCPASLWACINFAHLQHSMGKSSAGATPTTGASTSCSLPTAPTSCKGWPPRWRQTAEVLVLQEILWPSSRYWFGQTWSHPPHLNSFHGH